MVLLKRFSLGAMCLMLGLAATPLALRADYAKLSDGTTLRGTILPSPSDSKSAPDGTPKPPVTIQILDGSTTTVPAERILYSLRRPVKFEEYEQRLEQVDPSAAGHWELSEWCKKNGLDQDRRYHLQRVLDFDPQHPEAHRALGEFLVDGEWITQDEKMAQQGLIRYRGRYVLPDEAIREERSLALKSVAREWNKKIAAIRPRLFGPDKPKAIRELEEISDPSAIPGLLISLQDAPEQELRELLVRLLSRMHDPRATRALIAQGLFDVENKVSEAAFAAIPVEGRPLAVSSFVRALRHSSNLVVNRAAKGLATFEEPSSISQLISALNTDHMVPVRNVTTVPSGLGTIASGNLPILDDFSSYPAYFFPQGRALSRHTFDPRFPVIMTTLNSGWDGANWSPTASVLLYGMGGPRWAPMVERQVSISWERQPLPNPMVRAALMKFTGMDFGYDERSWSRWWASQQAVRPAP